MVNMEPRLWRFLSYFSWILPALLLAPDLAGGQDESMFYVRKDTWRHTMSASRARFLDQHDEPDVTLTPWYATAPLKTSLPIEW